MAGLAGAPATAATVAFTDRDAFVAASRGPLISDSFDANVANGERIALASGIVSTKSSPGIPPTLNRVRFGSYDGFVARDGFRDIAWNFATPVFGFGGDFSGGGSNFNSLNVTGVFKSGGGETFSITDAISADRGFFGLSSHRPLASVLFSTNAGIVLAPGAAPFGGQSFSVDNAVLAPIPVPAGFALMLGVLGVGAMLGWRQNRRTEA